MKRRRRQLSIILIFALLLAGLIVSSASAVEDTAFFNFESDLHGWTGTLQGSAGGQFGSSVLSQYTASGEEDPFVKTGSKSLKVDMTAYDSGDYAYKIMISTDGTINSILTEPGQKFTFNFFFPVGSSLKTIQIGHTGTPNYNSAAGIVKGSWFSVQYTTPSDGRSLTSFYITLVGNGGVNETAYIDSVAFTAAPTPEPTIEATPTPIVTPTPPVLPTPAFETDEADYNFESDIHGFTAQAATATYGELTLTRDITSAYAGNGMLSLTKQIGDSRVAYRFYMNNSSLLKTGDIYTFHVYIPSASPVNYIEVWSDYDVSDRGVYINLERDKWLTLNYTIPETSSLVNMWLNFVYTGDTGNIQYLAYVDSISYETPTPTATPTPEITPEPLMPSGVALTKSGDNFIIGINGWNSTHQYQIWTYQATSSEIFGGEGATNQWMLSLPYTLGSDRTAGGFTVEGDSITRNIGSFASVDSNYTVAVKVIDGAGNFVGQYKETFTPAEANVAGISKVTVDGQFADEKAFVKDISSGSPVQFFVTGNGATGTVFTARVDQKPEVVLSDSGAGNEFSWDISTMAPGNYSVTLTASTANDSDSRTINFRLYKVDYATPYGLLTGLEVAGGAESGKFKIDITPTVSGGKFRYRISEPWRTHFNGGDSGLIDIPGGVVSNTVIPDTAYGIYQVATYTYRDGVPSADDGAIRTVNNPRDGGVTLGVNVDGTPAGAEIVTKPKGTEIVFAAEVTVIPSAEYSFWRRDANGWVMIRDWAASGEITWTPNRVGLYTIQVRAKEAGGLTYEVLKNIEFDITYAGESRAVVTGITINQATLDSDASARTPILITANATADSQDLLYKFIISNGYIYYVETAYSADPTYMWVPGKAGNYTINVLVKNQASFGKYDGIGSFTVDVN